jgi:hypothetical protein
MRQSEIGREEPGESSGVFYHARISDDLRQRLRLRRRNLPAWRLFGWGKKGEEIEEREGFSEGESMGWLLAWGSGEVGEFVRVVVGVELGLEVREGPDRWVPPINGEKELKVKVKGERGGCCGLQSAGLAWAVLPRVGPVGCCPLVFVLIFFYFVF